MAMQCQSLQLYADLVIYSENIRDIDTNVDHVDSLLYRQVELVVVREHAEIPVADPPIVRPAHQVWVGLPPCNSLRTSRFGPLASILFVFFSN